MNYDHVSVNPSRPQKRGVCGYEAHKQVKGRKHHILVVDTLGLLLAVASRPLVFKIAMGPRVSWRSSGTSVPSYVASGRIRRMPGSW
jgi:hypothetical protein